MARIPHNREHLKNYLADLQSGQHSRSPPVSWGTHADVHDGKRGEADPDGRQHEQHTYAQTAEYIASGALSSLTNGASAMVFSTLYYNNRLQPCRIAINSTGTAPTECTDSGNTGNVMDLTYNFNYGSSDNGNLKKATDNRSGMSGRSINYNYDMLNRIANAYTDTTSGSYCWGETYTIDALGNLTGIGDVTSPDHTGTGCSRKI